MSTLQQKLLRLAEHACFKVTLWALDLLWHRCCLAFVLGWALRFKFELVQQAEVNELLAFLSVLLVSGESFESFTLSVLRKAALWWRESLRGLNNVTSEFSVNAWILCLKNRPFHVSFIFLLVSKFTLVYPALKQRWTGSPSRRDFGCTCSDNSWWDLLDLSFNLLGLTSRAMCVVEVKKRLLFIHQIE